MHLWQNLGAGQNGTTREVNDSFFYVKSTINFFSEWVKTSNRFFSAVIFLVETDKKALMCLNKILMILNFDFLFSSPVLVRSLLCMVWMARDKGGACLSGTMMVRKTNSRDKESTLLRMLWEIVENFRGNVSNLKCLRLKIGLNSMWT